MTVCAQVNVTAAPGANLDQMPSLAVVSGKEAAAPNGPGVVNDSLVMPPAPSATATAGVPCMSLTVTLVKVTLPVLETT